MTINFIELTPTTKEPENFIPDPSKSEIEKEFGNYVSFDRLCITKNIFKLVRPEDITVVKLYNKKLDQNKRDAYEKLKKLTADKNKSPNLLKLISFGELSNGYSYEQCEYKDNIVKILDDKKFVKQNIREFIKQIAGAINILHENNLLHLDVKPSNSFLISKNPGEFLLADYGTLVLLDEDQDLYETEHIGTLQFRDPECYSEDGKHQVTKAADYYSLGVTIETIVNKNPFIGYDKNSIQRLKLQNNDPRIDENAPSLRNINSLLKGLKIVSTNERWGYEFIIDWINNKIRQYNDDSGIINTTNNSIYTNLKTAMPAANNDDIFHFKKGEYDDTIVIFDKKLNFKGIDDESAIYNVYKKLIIQSEVQFQFLCFHGQNPDENLFSVEKNAILTIENSTIISENTFLLLSKQCAEVIFTNNKKIEVNIGIFLKNCTLTIKNSEIVAKTGPAIIATDKSNVILVNARIKTKHKSSPPILLKSNSEITIDDNTKIISEYGEYLAIDATSKCSSSIEEDKIIVYENIV